MKLVYTAFVLLLVILAGIVVHAPLSVWAGTIFPEFALEIKAWKEAILVIVFGLLAIEISRRKKWREILSEHLLQLAGVYVILHGVLLAVAWQGFEVSLAGIFINLRFIVYCVAWYICIQLVGNQTQVYRWVVKVIAAGAVIVAGFAFLQVTVLPNDILKAIGYSETTIQPYQTIDDNPDYVRINSTLRGPNPLGVYAATALSLVAAFGVARWRVLAVRTKVALSALVGMLGVALVASHSRSAAIALILSVVSLLFLMGVHTWRIWRDWRTVVGSVIVVGLAGLALLQMPDVVSNVILHDDPETGAVETSNSEHVDSFMGALDSIQTNQFGHGVGTTGSASILSDSARVIESYYLMIWYELGFVGIALFVGLYGLVLYKLWKNRHRHDWLYVGLFSGGFGVAFACLVLPVWADDTVSLVWWGLAGMALGMSRFDNSKKIT